MHKKRNLITTAVLLISFFGCHNMAVQNIPQPEIKTAVIQATEAPKFKLPDFSAIDDIKTRKHSFFGFLVPIIAAENQRIETMRSAIPQLDDAELLALAKKYAVQERGDDLKTTLLTHIDVIPNSLVLAQAAIESAWGTSRFAQQGNNLFGEWCFSKGCGIVPQARPANATHEVRRFGSPSESVRSYMHNLNSHKAYAKLRLQRADQRARQRVLSGCYLAHGLQAYSQKGLAYVEMIKTLIRSNRLENKNTDYCAPSVVAEPIQIDPTPQTPPNEKNTSA